MIVAVNCRQEGNMIAEGGKAENGANIGILMLEARYPCLPAP